MSRRYCKNCEARTETADYQEKKTVRKNKKKQKTDSDMIQVLQLPVKKFKVTIINMLNTLEEKAENVYEGIRNFIEQTEKLIKKIKNAFAGLIRRVHTEEEKKINELKDKSTKYTQTKIKKKKN